MLRSEASQSRIAGTEDGRCWHKDPLLGEPATLQRGARGGSKHRAQSRGHMAEG